MPLYPPNHHKKEYQKHQRKRGRRALVAYVLGILCLILFQYLRTSPRMAEFMEMIDRARVDRSFLFQVLYLLIMYALPAAGATAIIGATYILLFRRDE